MQFKDLSSGDAFTIADETDRPRRRILRKVTDGIARDDGGLECGVQPNQPVERVSAPRLTHAAWVRDDDTWVWVLRWVGPAGVSWGRGDAEDAPEPDRRLRSLVAATLHASGETAGTLPIYDELIAVCPEAPLLNNRGAAHAALGHLDAAIEDYTTALELDPGLAQAYSNRGNALTKHGRFDDAIADYDRALALAGDLAPVYCNRGLTRKLCGDLDGSLEDFDAALATDDAFGPAYLARGGVRALLHDVRGAIADLERFLELTPHAAQAEQVRAALQRLRATQRRRELSTN